MAASAKHVSTPIPRERGTKPRASGPSRSGRRPLCPASRPGTRLRARAAELGTPTPGEVVRARLEPAAVLWFDAASGARLPAGGAA